MKRMIIRFDDKRGYRRAEDAARTPF